MNHRQRHALLTNGKKKRRLRAVCAPHKASNGTSIGPKLSDSVRGAIMGAWAYPITRRSAQFLPNLVLAAATQLSLAAPARASHFSMATL